MKNKKSAGLKMKKSAAKMFGAAAAAGQRMMRSPNYTPPTQTDQGPMMGGALSPSQLSEAQKAQQEALRTQITQAYNEQNRKMEMPVNPYAPGVIGGGPRRFSDRSSVGNIGAQLAPFMMKKGSKPNKSEFFKGKK